MEPDNIIPVSEDTLSPDQKLEGFLANIKTLHNSNPKPSSQAVEFKIRRELEVKKNVSIEIAQLEHQHEQSLEKPKSLRAWMAFGVYVGLLCAVLLFGYYLFTSDSKIVHDNFPYLFAGMCVVIGGILYNIPKTIK